MGVTAGRLYVLQHIPHFDLIQQPQQYMQIGKWVSRLLSLRSMGCGTEGRVSGLRAQGTWEAPRGVPRSLTIKPVAAPTVS